jgi:hypothetical protein
MSSCNVTYHLPHDIQVLVCSSATCVLHGNTLKKTLISSHNQLSDLFGLLFICHDGLILLFTSSLYSFIHKDCSCTRDKGSAYRSCIFCSLYFSTIVTFLLKFPFSIQHFFFFILRTLLCEFDRKWKYCTAALGAYHMRGFFPCVDTYECVQYWAGSHSLRLIAYTIWKATNASVAFAAVIAQPARSKMKFILDYSTAEVDEGTVWL